ncbi:MAG: hypothetical protein CSA75_00810, partial [Sorangium cellulosum]
MRSWSTLLAVLIALCGVFCPRASFADEVTVVPGPHGGLGMWLVAGPFFGTERSLRFTTIAHGDDDDRIVVQVAQASSVLPGVGFQLRSARKGRFDLHKALRARRANTYALFGGVLRASSKAEVVLQLGADDGLRVTLDDKVMLDHNLIRPPLHDDDAVKLTLPPGDHSLLIRLRQRAGAWKFRARLLSAADLTPPRNVQFVLPGVDLPSTKAHLPRLIDVRLGLETHGDRYQPFLQISAEGGLPAGIPIPIIASGIAQQQDAVVDKFCVNLGHLPASNRRIHQFFAQLPPIVSGEFGSDEPTFAFEVKVAGHRTSYSRQGNASVRRSIATIQKAIDRVDEGIVGDPKVVRATLQLGRSRLRSFVSDGDEDHAATTQEAEQLETFAQKVIAGGDPLKTTTGPFRLAYPSPLDGKDRPFGVYIPPSFSAADPNSKRYPLVVVLHGLNGLPMQMIRIFFGKDDWRRAPWEDRHLGTLKNLDAFVVSPTGFGNMAYREFGEMDVMHLVEWMRESFPIDENRVYVTGLSMGGSGAGAIGLRYADQFAAIEPLCGYHSYALRRDMANRKLRFWEKALASFWSNVAWADNGRNLPLYVVHGKKDKPVANSKVLIDRYLALGYTVYAEHPDVGHNVWQQTYKKFKGYQWLARHKRDPEPKEVVLRTASLRYADHAWVHVEQLEEHLKWGRVRARICSRSKIVVDTSAVRAIRLDWPFSHVDESSTLIVQIDGDTLKFAPNSDLSAHLQGDKWVAGPPQAPTGLAKTVGLTGPIRDAFLEPLVFVVGTKDPSLTFANEQVARALANPPYGVEARWPVVADVDVDEVMAASHALYLVGSARSNAYVEKIADRLPIRVEGHEIVVGSKRFGSQEVGTLFVYPNPLHPQRYVVVLAAPDVAGTLRALSLPRMLPD